MTANKYGNFLTVLLIVLIGIIIIVSGVLVYNYVIKDNSEENKKIEAFAELDKNAVEEEKEVKPNSDEQIQEGMLSNGITPPDSSNTKQKPKKKTYYEGFVMLGYITISKTNVKEPILDTVTPEALNKAVAILYPSNAKLNEPGNVVIIGHNYRNGKFFSNNGKLSIGDKIRIKDETGRELTYTIYQKFETSETDTSFYTRDTNGIPEITLSTCTDNSEARIIILAKAD